MKILDNGARIEFERVAELPCGAYGPHQETYYRVECETGRSQIKAFKKLCEERNFGIGLTEGELEFD